MNPDVEHLVRSYFRSGSEPSRLDEERFDAWREVDLRIRRDAVSGMQLVLALIEVATEDQLAQVGTGPLEVLLARHGGEIMDALRAEVSTNSKLRRALEFVCLADVPDVEREVEAILASR